MPETAVPPTDRHTEDVGSCWARGWGINNKLRSVSLTLLSLGEGGPVDIRAVSFRNSMISHDCGNHRTLADGTFTTLQTISFFITRTHVKLSSFLIIIMLILYCTLLTGQTCLSSRGSTHHSKITRPYDDVTFGIFWFYLQHRVEKLTFAHFIHQSNDEAFQMAYF